MIKTKRISTVTLLAFALTVLSPSVYAHGGGLNNSGCHNETATGGYHCHQEEKANSTQLVVAGVLLLVVLVPMLMKKSESPTRAGFSGSKKDSKSYFQLTPYETNESAENSKGTITGLRLEYKF